MKAVPWVVATSPCRYSYSVPLGPYRLASAETLLILQRLNPLHVPLPLTVTPGQFVPGEIVHSLNPVEVGVNRMVTLLKADDGMQ